MDRTSLAAKAYREIERMIISQEIPPASLVSESFLTEKTGLGRTPVREALQRLSRDRLVQIHPNRGVLVPAVTVESQLQLLEMRRAMEVLAVTLACERLRPGQREGMTAMTARLASPPITIDEYAETIHATHQMISAASHNEFLIDAMTPLQSLSRRFWLLHVTDEKVAISEGAELHHAILSAILASRTKDAVEASLALNDYLVAYARQTIA